MDEEHPPGVVRQLGRSVSRLDHDSRFPSHVGVTLFPPRHELRPSGEAMGKFAAFAMYCSIAARAFLIFVVRLYAQIKNLTIVSPSICSPTKAV